MQRVLVLRPVRDLLRRCACPIRTRKDSRDLRPGNGCAEQQCGRRGLPARGGGTGGGRAPR
eukprot:scaffold124118_cov69-Phaeocystis_antarctica.AAC.1